MSGMNLSETPAPPQLPIDQLQLAAAPIRALHRAGIFTVGDLWARFVADPELGTIGAPSRKQAAEIRAGLIAFRKLIARERPEDLENFPDPRPLLIPAPDQPLPNLIALVPVIAEALSTVHDSAREYEILRRRYGFGGSAVYTLEEIGLYHGLTRERVRQIEERAKRRLVDALRDEDPGTHRLSDSIHSEFNELGLLFRSGPPLILESEVARQLAVRYGTTLTPDQRLALLLELWGAIPVRPGNVGLKDSAGNVWSWSKSPPVKRIARVVQAVRAHLEEVARPESLFHLSVVVNRSSKERIPPEDVRLSITLMEEVEEVAPDEVRWRFEHLRSLGDKAYAVLLDAGAPLHFTEIARKINQRMAAAGFPPSVTLHQSLGSQLSMDERFESVGRSGTWKLKDWDHVRTDSIANLMREALAARQEPLTYDEIHAYVVQHRPEVPRQSILSLVTLTADVFVRRSGGRVELVGWGKSGLPELDPRRSREIVRQQIQQAVLDLVVKSGDEPLPLATLVREIRARTQLPENTIRTRLKRADWAQLTTHATHRSVKIDVAALEQEVTSPPRARIRTDVEKLVNEYLESRPHRRASIGEIWKHIRRLRPKLKRPTLYSILSRLPGLSKERVETRVFYWRNDA
jgi:hypothetical protein